MQLHAAETKHGKTRMQVIVGFGFTSDWMTKWREYFKPIAKRSNAKQKHMQVTFNSQVKTALHNTIFLSP